MSGYDVCARIKSDPATRSIPIIILTAADNEQDRQDALRAGADGFFPKMRGWQPSSPRCRRSWETPEQRRFRSEPQFKRAHRRNQLWARLILRRPFEPRSHGKTWAFS